MPSNELIQLRTPRPRSLSYQPLLLVAVAAATGVLMDRFLLVSIWLWLIVFAGSMLGWTAFIIARQVLLSSWLILLATGALAGSWHQFRCNWYACNDVGRLASEDPQPICVMGVLASEPDWVAAPPDDPFNAIPIGEQSRLRVVVRELVSGKRGRVISGRIECRVSGQVPNWQAGSTLKIAGQLRAIPRPSNPGEFDFHQFHRDQRRLAQITVAYPQAVQRIERPQGVFAGLGRLRSRFNEMIWKHVGISRAPLASAILLGNREQLNPPERETFLLTGTIHLLAISGLHVGILAGSILFISRLGWVPWRMSLLLVIAFVIFYAWLVEYRTPVVRATILIVIFCLAKLLGRSGLSFNSLALALLVVLIMNPTQLLNVGAQLSFLAVAALGWFYKYFVRIKSSDPLDRLIERTRPRSQRIRAALWDKVRIAFLVSGTIWVIALPLVAERFHVVAPVALLINPLLLLPLTIGLLSGFAVMVLGLLFPPLADLLGLVCNGSLAAIEFLVNSADQLPGAHFWTAGPGTTAVVLFYLGGFFLIIFPWTRVPRRWGILFVVAWLAFGCVWPASNRAMERQNREELVGTFIDVGHGTSVLLEMPGGYNLLYDCGSFGSPTRSVHAISSVLWHKRISHLDGVILSHADLDHYSALPGLLERFAIDQVLLSPVFLEATDPAIDELGGYLRHKTELRTVQQLDRLKCPTATGSGPQMTIWGPPPGGVAGSDNANSIVLGIAHDGIRLLLPGDLEQAGLDYFLTQRHPRFDVVMAPHHGSRNSRPYEFYSKCDPAIVVISGGRDDLAPDVFRWLVKRGARVAHTGFDGAWEISIADGDVRLRRWVDGAWQIQDVVVDASNCLVRQDKLAPPDHDRGHSQGNGG